MGLDGTYIHSSAPWLKRSMTTLVARPPPLQPGFGVSPPWSSVTVPGSTYRGRHTFNNAAQYELRAILIMLP